MRYTNSSPSTPLSAGPRFQDSLATERLYARAPLTPGPGRADRSRLCVEAGRQPEQREHALGVEEERELLDPAVLDLQHLQRPRLVAAALGRPVLADCGGA